MIRKAVIAVLIYGAIVMAAFGAKWMGMSGPDEFTPRPNPEQRVDFTTTTLDEMGCPFGTKWRIDGYLDKPYCEITTTTARARVR